MPDDKALILGYGGELDLSVEVNDEPLLIHLLLNAFMTLLRANFPAGSNACFKVLTADGRRPLLLDRC